MVRRSVRLLRGDERAVVMVEAVLVLVPLLTLGLAVLELGRYAISGLMLQRAAGIAVRACAVIKEQPPNCDSNHGVSGQNSAAQDEQITEAARRALEPLGKSTLTLDGVECEVGKDGGGSSAQAAPDTVNVFATYHCAVPLAGPLLCHFDYHEPTKAPHRNLRATAQYGHQGARYDCDVSEPFTAASYGF